MKQEQFDKLMETYRNTHESSLLTYARDLYMVVTFLGVAYLVFKVLIQEEYMIDRDTVPSSVWDAIEQDYGKDEILDHILDDWLADEMAEEAEAQGLW